MCNIISSVLNEEKDISVIGVGTDVHEAIELVNQKKADVVLISSRLPDKGSITLTKLLVQSNFSPRILILGITETRESVLEYIEAGATGYVLRESSLDDLLTAIRAVNSGKALVSPEIAAALIQRVSEFVQAFDQAGVTHPESLNLTPREYEVLDLLGQNLNNQEIAQLLVIEVGTVKNHVHSILRKLGVSSREDAAKLSLVLKNKLKP
jgi:DNA-binding NarL/FixJ family response regulator